jgi:2-hydroxychromene-2-carboxylate isomerase
MARTVEFYFDYGSPASYLAFRRLPGIAARTGATVIDRPILLGAVLKQVGNIAPAAVPAKGRWMMQDLARWAKRLEIPLRINPFFPIVTLPLMRGAIAMRRLGRLAEYSEAMFTALWVDGRDMGDPVVVGQVLEAAGFDSPGLVAAIADPAIKDELKADTDAAIARGVFGAPTFFVGDEQHFGQDRLDFVEETLTRAL